LGGLATVLIYLLIGLFLFHQIHEGGGSDTALYDRTGPITYREVFIIWLISGFVASALAMRLIKANRKKAAEFPVSYYLSS